MSETHKEAPPVKRHWQWLLGLLLLLVVVALVFFWWRGPLVTVDSVVRREFVQSVVASGHVETPHRVDIGSQLMATVKSVPMAEGQNVQAGQLLVELESDELLAAQAQAAATLAQAANRVRQLREVQGPVAEQSLRQAQIGLDNARAMLKRNQELFNKGFIGAAALDDGRKNVDVAMAQVSALQKQLESARSGGSDYAIAESAVDVAKAAFDAAHARLKYARILAPTSGTVIVRNVEAGDVVTAGKSLMTISPVGRVQLVVQIDERNLHLIAPGQKALASADAYAQQRFAAQLAYINPAVNVQTGSVEVKLDVQSAPATLRQDMTVSVDIEVARKPGTLLVPLASVHDVDGKGAWVLRLEKGIAVRRPVRLGLTSGGWGEVLGGVAEGDALLPVSSRVVAGARVRAQAQKADHAQ
jgi:HlyD family secretion protein